MEQVKKFRNIPRENQIGFLAPLLAFICILVSSSILPGFDWSVNALSDLGSWFRTDLGDLQILSAILFNGGLIMTGLLILYFVIQLIKQSIDVPTKIAFAFFAGTALFLTGIGVFSEDTDMFHYWTAVPFFLSIPIALGAVGIAWLRFPEMRIVGGSSILLSIVSLLIMFQPWLTLSIAVFETLEALVAMGWLWFVNYMHYTGRLSQAFNLQEAK